MFDDITKASHYNQHPSGIECKQIIRHMNFNLGSVFKYIWRNGLKSGNPSLKDLKKAKFYLEDEIQRLEEEKPSNKFINDT